MLTPYDKTHLLDKDSLHQTFRSAHDALHQHLVNRLTIVEEKASHAWFTTFLEECLEVDKHAPQDLPKNHHAAFFVGLEYARHKIWRALHIHTDYGIEKAVCKESILAAFSESAPLTDEELHALSQRTASMMDA